MSHGGARVPQVKICGLTRRPDVELAASAGATYGGVILAPGGKRSIGASQAAALFAGSDLRRVGVFVNAALPELVSAAETAALDVVQLHGDEDPAYVRALREAGGWTVWKAVRPRDGAEFVRAAERFAGLVDGLLLDGWSAEARGGTGAQFPWEAVAERRSVLGAEIELIAAGGLRPDNVGRAVALLRPAVVDVSSGVESAPGIKDSRAVLEFVAAVRAACVSISG